MEENKEVAKEIRNDKKKKKEKKEKMKPKKEGSQKSGVKKLFSLFLPEFICILLSAGITGSILYTQEASSDNGLRCLVMIILGIAAAGFQVRQEYIYGKFAYDNGEHWFRYWNFFLFSLVISMVCVFLPNGCWPFLAIFVTLSLFSNVSTGIFSSAVLLMIPCLLTNSSITIYMLYLISGIFAVALFSHIENDFKVGIPFFLSLLCLLVCLTANMILTANEKPNAELFVIPLFNILISSVLLLGILKIFSTLVIFKYREMYLDWNDVENPVLVAFKKESKEEYLISIHTAYFCERIAAKLSLNVDLLKCAAYYHRTKNLTELMEQNELPPQVITLLQEYQKGKKRTVFTKEAAVLLCSDSIISTISYMLVKNNDSFLDYDQIIDTLFKRFQETGAFNQCNLTLKELNIIQKTFKEEKLYYDFLH